MRLEHESYEKIKEGILAILRKYLDLEEYRVFFFGSRVAGNNFEHADIDIGVEGPKPIPADVRLEINEDLENLPILYKIDFVDFKEVSEEFRKIALQQLEYIN